MKCPECQSENREDVKFCEECGAKMEIVCPNCGNKIPMGKKFCGECGQKLGEPQETKENKETQKIDYEKPHSYTPKFMAEKILTTRSSVEGERKLVTVLFADVASFTSLSERLDPEEVHEIMDGCFKILMEEIHNYEGTINQFTGDGVMALFGAPLSHEDHAQRACHASLGIQRALRRYEEKVNRSFGVDFKMRIGLNSGPVVVGAIGDDLRMDYTAVGDTTNLAARMESLADPGSIMISAKTYRLAKAYFELKSLGEVPIKGKAEPQEVFELKGVSDVVTRLDASATKGLTKYIGRDLEVETLLQAFEKVQSGSGQIVGIVGEAGVGKSRLIFELRNKLGDDCQYLEGRCVQSGTLVPFLPLLDVLRLLFDIKEGEQGQSCQEKMREKILSIDSQLGSSQPAYQDLLSIPVEDPEWNRLEPKEKREKTFEALRNLLIRLSQNKPLILTVDDIHWIDKSSEEFLDYFIDWLTHTPILLLLLHRPEYTHPWGSKTYYRKIGLDQLSIGTSAQLVQSILEDGDMVPELRELILSRSAGNPLFMEELTYALLENGSIEKRDSKYVLSAKASKVEVPDNVQGIIASRMDRLEDSIKRTMQVASVIGRDFAYSILQVITGLREELKSYLQKLQGLEFIYEKNIFPELEYIFKHAVTQEVAYGSLLLQKRKELHERIGEAIEAIHGEKIEEYIEMLAYQYSRSNNRQKAYHYLKLSGDKATRNNSAWEAYNYYKEAIGALKRLPETEEDKKDHVAVVHAIIIPMIMLGFPKDSPAILEEGARLAEELGDKKSLIRFYSNIGLYHTNRGRITEGNRYSGRAFEEASRMQDVESMAQSGPDICLTNISLGRYEKVIEVSSTVVAVLEKADRKEDTFGGPANVYPTMKAICGYCHGMLGRFPEAIRLSEEGLRKGKEIGRPVTLGICSNYMGMLGMAKGDCEYAKEQFEAAIRYFKEANFINPMTLSLSGLGTAQALLGDPEKGCDSVKKALQILRDGGIEWFLSYHYQALGICQYESGDLDEAKGIMEEALRISRENSEQHVMGTTSIWLGRIIGKRDSGISDEAEKYLVQGAEVLESLKTRPDCAKGYLFLGELQENIGRQEKAQENLNRAEGMFKEMDMGYWLSKTRNIQEASEN